MSEENKTDERPDPDSYRDGKTGSREEIISTGEKPLPGDIAMPKGKQSKTPASGSKEAVILEIKTTDQTETKEDMEVHHHSHAHGKKSWKTYIWEFLMLFFAVFCGFLAEYQLEHTIEHQREKQYIQFLVSDLKSDQQVLTQHILHVKTGISMMDSVINILNTPLLIENNTRHLYYLARLAPRLIPLSTNNRTFEQLKNSGNFRLIRNLSTSNRIMTYYEKFPVIRMLESVNETEFTEYKKAASKIFNPAVFIKMEGENNEIKRTGENPALRTTDNEILQELSIFSVYMHGTKKGILEADEGLKIAGSELIEYLQKEYHLE